MPPCHPAEPQTKCFISGGPFSKWFLVLNTQREESNSIFDILFQTLEICDHYVSAHIELCEKILSEIDININVIFVFHLNVTMLDICDHYELVPILAGARASPYIELRDKKVLSKTRSWVKFYILETLTWIVPCWR